MQVINSDSAQQMKLHVQGTVRPNEIGSRGVSLVKLETEETIMLSCIWFTYNFKMTVSRDWIRHFSTVLVRIRVYVFWARIFKLFKKPQNRFQGINSASLCSLAGSYDNPVPSRFLASRDCLKIPAQLCSVHERRKTGKLHFNAHILISALPNFSLQCMSVCILYFYFL